MLQVDVAPPAEQDQRDVEGQRDAATCSSRAEDGLGALELAGRRSLPFQISRTTAAIEDAENDAVAPRAVERRSAPMRRGA